MLDPVVAHKPPTKEYTLPYVMIAVPAELVPQIAQLVAEHAGESVFLDGPEQPEVNGQPVRPMAAGSQAAEDAALINGWTPELLRRYYAESTDMQRGFLDYLAANPGTWVGSSEVADNVAKIKSFNSVPGVLSGLFRRVKRYDMTQVPFLWQKSQGLFLHSMPAAAANVITQAATEYGARR